MEATFQSVITQGRPARRAPGIADGLRWYCVQARPKREHLAAASLQLEEGVEAFCPRIRYRKKTRRGLIWFLEAMFPTYLFARFDYARHNRFVSYALGVSTIVRFGQEVGVLADEIVEELQARCSAVGGMPIIEIDPHVNEGDIVKVEAGPFHGVDALVTRVLPAKERVKILIELLGRQVEVELGTDAVLPNGSPRGYL
jgi:transcriptional antiterminator RfaH